MLKGHREAFHWETPREKISLHARISRRRRMDVNWHTPVRPRIRADIPKSNQRLLLQQLDIGQEARAPDAPDG
jgi:hypothetical protein